jgi:hypothetical protein
MAIASDSSDMLMETEVGVVYSMIPGKNMKLVSMYPPKCSKPDEMAGGNWSAEARPIVMAGRNWR